MAQLVINSQLIDDDSNCYVIAEIGHNHQGRVETAMELFQAAKESGAHAVKLQKRDNRSLFTQAMFDQPYDNENSFGPTYGAHREALEFGRAEYQTLKQYAHELKLTFFATAFDIPSADFLAELEMPAFKIASGDLTNIPLIEHVARFGRPILVSTGGAQLDDVRRAHDAVMAINSQLCLLQCTAGYPCAFEELNLRVISTYRQEFPEAVAGFSGHDNGIAMALVAYQLGARIIEKHFTLNRAMKGTDHPFSLERSGLRRMVRDLERARVALGDGVKQPYASEMKALKKMSKKLVAARPLPAGHRLTAADVAIKSPGDGLAPYQLDQVLGQMTRRALAQDENIEFGDLQRDA